MAMTVVQNQFSLRVEIQRLLHGLANEGRFFRCFYGRDGLPKTIDPETAARETPLSISVNEVAAEMEPDSAYGRAVAQRRTSWQFEMILDFPNEVTVAFFEQDVMNPVPRVNRTSDHVGALLRLTRVEYKHPTRQAGSGSSVLLTWEASVGR